MADDFLGEWDAWRRWARGASDFAARVLGDHRSALARCQSAALRRRARRVVARSRRRRGRARPDFESADDRRPRDPRAPGARPGRRERDPRPTRATWRSRWPAARAPCSCGRATPPTRCAGTTGRPRLSRRRRSGWCRPRSRRIDGVRPIDEAVGEVAFTVAGQPATLVAYDDDGGSGWCSRTRRRDGRRTPPAGSSTRLRRRRRHRRPRLQPHHQPAVRLHRLHDLPGAAPAEPAAVRDRGGGAGSRSCQSRQRRSDTRISRSSPVTRIAGMLCTCCGGCARTCRTGPASWLRSPVSAARPASTSTPSTCSAAAIPGHGDDRAGPPRP